MSELLLEPHHDDAVLFSCWNLLRYRPLVVTVLRSDRMADPKYPGGMVVTHEQRVAETEQAMGWLGVEWAAWDYSDKDPRWAEITTALAELDEEHGFDHVFAPAMELDGNEQHTAVGRAASRVFGDRLTRYLTYTTGGRSRGGTEVPFEPDWPILKLRALACYESQIRHPATAPHFVEGLREWVA